MKNFIPLVAVLALTACGSTQQLADLDIGKPIRHGTARIVVERSDSLIFGAATAVVELNGLRIGSLGRGAATMGDAKAGPETLTVWTAGATGHYDIHFNAKAGQTYKFMVTPYNATVLIAGGPFSLIGEEIHGATGSPTSGYFQIKQVQP